ncbi:hypothetical protein K1719_028573 [Acacia pycnantha]|nr:hypothetical protein K1719_028573 [Acacia pycnantha]
MALLMPDDSEIPLSKEENDILHRNAKKSKNDEGNHHGEEWPKLGTEGINQKISGTSFADKLKGTKCKAVARKPVSGSHVGGGVIGPSTEQEVDSGQGAATAEEWKVVQRPRRQKKPSKEAKQGDGRRKEEGSRFGVLAEEGNSGFEEQIATDRVAVQEVAVEVNLPRIPMSALQSRDKKSESKKKQRKEQLQVREKRVQKLSKHELRKEKRARDLVQDEKQRKESLMATYGETKREDRGEKK